MHSPRTSGGPVETRWRRKKQCSAVRPRTERTYMSNTESLAGFRVVNCPGTPYENRGKLHRGVTTGGGSGGDGDGNAKPDETFTAVLSCDARGTRSKKTETTTSRQITTHKYRISISSPERPGTISRRTKHPSRNKGTRPYVCVCVMCGEMRET